MKLGDRINLNLEISGRITARTREGDPKFDIELPWGTLVGVPLSVIEHAGSRPQPAVLASERRTPGQQAGMPLDKVTTLLPRRRKRVRRLARSVGELARSG